MLQVLAGDNQALQIYRVVIGEAGHSDIGSLFIESGISESMGTLSMLMAEAMRKGELTEGDPVIRAAQFTALVKAEADAMILKRDLPRYTSAQINLMARKGAFVSLWRASPERIRKQAPCLSATGIAAVRLHKRRLSVRPEGFSFFRHFMFRYNISRLHCYFVVYNWLTQKSASMQRCLQSRSRAE